MRKTFLLDTNVLMRSPYAYNVFEEHDVLICTKTLEELDNLKTKPGEAGFSAREAIRTLNELREKGSLFDGITLPGGGKLTVVRDEPALRPRPLTTGEEKADDIIIRAALNHNAILVTEDISMALKAESVGLVTESFKNERVSDVSMNYTGRADIYVPSKQLSELYKKGSIKTKSILDETGEQAVLQENEFLIVHDADKPKSTALAVHRGDYIEKINPDAVTPYGVKARNVGQKFAIEALLRPAEEIPLVFIKGAAGTAKTFLSLACGLDAVMNRKEYKRILILRPNIKFDDDIGFLKGDEMDKIMPLIRPCLDNLEALVTKEDDSAEEAGEKIKKLFDKGVVNAEALAYLRGRSISNTYILIDEAQNTTPNQILGIITRAGIGSKIVIVGDPDQIDNPKVNKRSNGLVYASEKMLGSSLCMQMTFADAECVRSQLALEASKLLSSLRN